MQTLLVALLGAAAVACSGSGGHAAAPATRPHQVSTPSTEAATSRTTDLAPLSSRLSVPERIAGGSKVHATLIIDNATGRDLQIFETSNRVRCTPEWAIVLGNRHVQEAFGFHMDCGVAPLLVRRGENKYEASVVATYGRCSPLGGPYCVGSPLGPPPLPRGRYYARLVLRSDLPGIPAPPPVLVTVT